MRKGRASNTAQFVAFNRALGNLSPQVSGFSDPAAERFLPPRWANKVERARARLPRSPLPFWARGMAIFNQFRTAVLDRAILDALPFKQLVILGAELDGRAWRLSQLADTTVFEVDHPDTQALKKERAASLPALVREVRFVPVDFRRDDLAAQLSFAGFDADQTTFWLWEGVTMYLAPSEVQKTLTALGRVSAPGSGLAMTYLARKNGRVPKSLFLVLLGEPVRSAFSLSEITELAATAGWATFSNTGIHDWKPALAPQLELTERQVGLQWNERVWVGRR